MLVVSTSEQTIPEMGQSLQNDLQIKGLDKSACQALVDLSNWVDENGKEDDVLTFIERNAAFLIGVSRLTVDSRKEEKEAEQSLKFTADEIEDAARANGLFQE
jgi:hypothetical protein